MEIKDTVKSLAALAQETRLKIFRLLVEVGPEGLTVGKIGQVLSIPPATLSFHLKELTHANLVETRNEARFIYCAANFTTMNGLVAYLTENCCGNKTTCMPVCKPVMRKSSGKKSLRRKS